MIFVKVTSKVVLDHAHISGSCGFKNKVTGSNKKIVMDRVEAHLLHKVILKVAYKIVLDQVYISGSCGVKKQGHKVK